MSSRPNACRALIVASTLARPRAPPPGRPVSTRGRRSSRSAAGSAAAAATSSPTRSLLKSISYLPVARARLSSPSAADRIAAASVLRSSIAIVIGPTPPGTGVIAPPRSATAVEVDVAHQPVGAAVDAHVDHRRPGLDELGAHQSRHAHGRHQHVGAARTRPAGRAVREWHTVTVALRSSSIAASGRPTSCERPSTTASAPSSGDVVAVQQLDHPGRGAGPQPEAALGQQPGVGGRQPVHVLGGIDQRGQRAGDPARRAAAAGAARPIRRDRRSGRASSAATASAALSAPRRWSKPAMPTSAQARCLPLTYTSEAGSSPTSTVARPGGRPTRDVSSATSRATSARTSWATAAPVDHRRRHRAHRADSGA